MQMPDETELALENASESVLFDGIDVDLEYSPKPTPVLDFRRSCCW